MFSFVHTNSNLLKRMPPNIRASFPFSLFFHFSKDLFSLTRTTEETRKNPKKNVLFTRDVTAVERGKVRDPPTRQSDRRSSRAIRKSTLLLLRSAAIPPDSREQCNSEFLLHTKEEVTHTPFHCSSTERRGRRFEMRG